MSIRRVLALPAGALLIAGYSLGGFAAYGAACGANGVSLMAVEPPAPEITIADGPASE